MAKVELGHDLEFVRRAQQGDRSAFGVLVRKYQHRVIALVGRYITDWSECHDVAQETFVKAYRAIGRFRGDSQFATWLHRIAVNTAMNHLAASRRKAQLDGDLGSAITGEEGRWRCVDTDTPEHELMRHELEQTVMRAVQQLPDELRLAMTLREVEGLSYEAIAQVMGCPIGTVRSRLFRAREAIDAVLQPYVETISATRHRRRL